jgi:acetyl-CoA acetyltransferase family protein
MSGVQDCVIAGGVEVMSTVPIGSNVMDSAPKGRGIPMPQSVKDRFPECTGLMFSQFDGAEILAKKVDVSRKDMDEFAVLSHKRAVHATKNGYFKNEIIPLTGFDKKENKEVAHDTDEGIRPGTNIEGLSKLKTLAKNGQGRITAGTSSQICDGASAVLICNEKGLKALGLKPRAKITSMALAGTDPVMMLYGPVPATKTALANQNLTIKDIDLYEVNEAFASVPLAWKKELGADMNKLNVNGGAMALGHPLGATGTKLLTTLINELERRKLKRGLLAICEGAGTANATIIETCSDLPSSL